MARLGEKGQRFIVGILLQQVTCRIHVVEGAASALSVAGLISCYPVTYHKASKQRWTKIAEPYPARLCVDFGVVIVEAIENRQLLNHQLQCCGHIHQ